MARLEPGFYTFSVEAPPLGKFKGFAPLTLLTVSSSDKKVATIDSAGILTIKKSGTATITISDATGTKMKCKLTAVQNSFSRKKPPYVKSRAALFSSTKQLYYSKGALNAEVFLYNLTLKTLTGLGACVLELYDGETLIHSQPLPPQTFKTALKHKSYEVLRFTLSDAQLPGISTKSLDLGSQRFPAVLRGADTSGNIIAPVIPSTLGAVAAKSTNALHATAHDAAQPIE